MLGDGATISGSLNLDGSEVWDGSVSASQLRARWKRNRRQISNRSISVTVCAPEMKLTSVHEFGSFSFRCNLSALCIVRNHHTKMEIEVTEGSMASEGVETTATQLFSMNRAVVSYDTSSIDGRGFVQVNLGTIPIVVSNVIGQAAMWAANQWLDIGMQATDFGATVKKSMSREMRQKQREIDRKKKIEMSMATFITIFKCAEVELLILNDTSSTQNGGKQLAARLRVSDISSDSHRVLMPGADEEEEEQMHNSLALDCAIVFDVMNQNNASWEPLCESFQVHLQAAREGPKAMVVEIQGKPSPSQFTTSSTALN